jgi:DNA-directed RNA polymerase specialized sigma24 family protein
MTITQDAAPQLGGPLAEFLDDRIPRVAGNAHKRYPRIPVDDYVQAIWLRVLEHPDKFQAPFESGDHGIVVSRLNDAAWGIQKEDRRYTTAADAAEKGYSVDDLYFYSTGLLAMLMAVMVAADMDAAEAVANSTKGQDAAGVRIRASDPHGAENYQVLLIDVASAYGRLTEGQRRLLRAYYGARQDDTQDGRWEREQLASSMGLTAEALRQRAFRALLRLQAELGGSDPWQ